MSDAGSRASQEIPLLAAVVRGFDRRPMHAGLYVTDRCNLACRYCAEFNNTAPHPTFAELARRIDRIAGLGVVKIALAGGEPLLHPEIDAVIGHAKGRGLTVSMSTNALLLDAPLLRRLEAAGLDALQVSTDRITPSRVTRKALELQLPALELLRGSSIRTHLSGVICADTLDEAGEVLRRGLALGLPTELRPVHADEGGAVRVPEGERRRTLELIEVQLELKRRGHAVHGMTAVLEHYRSRLLGSEPAWRCVAGYKIFFVSAAGRFWPCSVLRTEKPFDEVGPEDLLRWDCEKPCQAGCGIACAIQHSLYIRAPLRYVAGEIPGRIRRSLRGSRG